MFGFGKNKPASSAQPDEADEQMQLFVELVMGQAQNILFVLGQLPTPDGRRAAPDLEAGRMLIDQLDMLRVKTAGNLTAEESEMLEKALAQTRMLFIELAGRMGELEAANRMREKAEKAEAAGAPTIMAPAKEPAKMPAPAPQPAPAPRPETPAPAQPPAASAPDPEEDESSKRFVKNYGAF